MTSKNTKFYSLILIIIDTLVLLATFTIAYIARVQYDPRPLLSNIHAYDYLRWFVLIIPFWIIVFAALGLYQRSTYNRRLVEWSKILLGTFLGILLVIGWQYVAGKDILPARLVAVYGFVGSFILIVVEREIMRAIRGLMFKYGRGVSRVLLIGSSGATSDIARSLADTAKSGYEIIAIAGPKTIVPDELKIHQYSHLETALRDIELNEITAIIQTDLYESGELNQKILNAAQLRHISYSFIPGQPEFYSGKNTVDVFLGYPMISVSQTPLIGWGAIVKRLFDIVCSVLLIIVTSPIFLVLIILQKLLNPGSIFYLNQRLSRHAKPFYAYKFRSMTHLPGYDQLIASEEFRAMGREDLALEYERDYKVENDPRITPFGHFLRRTSLDELPQLFNILKGDLSLVGPRPLLAKEIDAKYSRQRGALLLSVRSGLTGLWQVSGRNDITEDQRIQIELYYVQNWTFWLDIKILFKTVWVVINRKGAW